MKRARDGFTLIEVLISMVVLGILATIAIPRYTTARENAFEAAAISDLRNLATVQEIHWRLERGYSDDVGILRSEVSTAVELEITEATNNGWAARASHRSFPARSCGVFYGDADPANATPADVVGVIRCGF